jgi:hypothetical protein
MLFALHNMAATCISKHIWDVVIGIDLEKEPHFLATDWAIPIGFVLHPIRPASQLVSWSG